MSFYLIPIYDASHIIKEGKYTFFPNINISCLVLEKISYISLG